MMKLKTRIDGGLIRHHFTYHWWKYALVILVSLLGWNLFYTMTRYRPPQDKRIDVYIQSATTTAEAAQPLLHAIWKEAVPQMETVEVAILQPPLPNDMYAVMQLTTYLAAGEGDIYILTEEYFKRFAAQGAFLPLEGFVAQGQLQVDGLDLARGYVATEPGEAAPGAPAAKSERHLYGIPAQALNGFASSMYVDNRGLYLCVAQANGNTQAVITFLNALIQKTLAPDAPQAVNKLRFVDGWSFWLSACRRATVGG